MSSISKAYKKGQALKDLAKMQLNLTPEEIALFDQVPIKAISQKNLNKLSGFPSQQIPYETSGMTMSDILPPDVSIRDQFPYIPRLTFENFANLPAYDTEADVIAHEMGHAKDLIERGISSEPSAIAFERSITGRMPEAMGGTIGDAFIKSVGVKRDERNIRKNRFFFR